MPASASSERLPAATEPERVSTLPPPTAPSTNARSVRRVMMLMTPPIASVPNSAERAPFTVSTRSITAGAMCWIAAAPTVPGLMRTPSIRTSVWLLSVPRRNTEVACPGPPCRPISSPASKRSSSARSDAIDCSISCRVITCTGTIASVTGIGERVAVTIMLSSGSGRSAPAAVTETKTRRANTARIAGVCMLSPLRAARTPKRVKEHATTEGQRDAGNELEKSTPASRPPRHSRVHRAGLRAYEWKLRHRHSFRSVAPSRDENDRSLVAVALPLLPWQGLRVNSFSVGGAAPESAFQDYLERRHRLPVHPKKCLFGFTRCRENNKDGVRGCQVGRLCVLPSAAIVASPGRYT